MIDRKKKLRTAQFLLLLFGIIIIYFTYYNKKSLDEKIISKDIKEKVQNKNDTGTDNKEMFLNIEYTGLDLNGNRYLLKAEKASLNEEKPEMVNMELVEATFYFKDDTVLYVWSDKGIYNNKTLDMKFNNNVKAEYMESKLFADGAEYSNTENYLSIHNNVRIDDVRGNLIADKLLFDITKQKLDITSFNKGKISANVKLNEKRF
tara:strand:- start:5151 stop:5765 length:615 start_codon:yes stop_codon:yes gene_type:complete